MKAVIEVDAPNYQIGQEVSIYFKDTMMIKGIVQEPCDDAISRQAVQDYIAKYLSQYLYNDVREAVEVIDEYIGELPSVNPKQTEITLESAIDYLHSIGWLQKHDKELTEWVEQEPKTGHREYNDIYDHYLCGNCKTVVMDYDNYCPNCGAKMVEGSDTE